MIRSLETTFGQTPTRKNTSIHDIVTLLLISIATILLSALPANALANSGIDRTRNFGYDNLLLFGSSSLHGPLK